MYKNLEELLPRFAEYFHNKFGEEKSYETIMSLGITDMKYFPTKNILWIETSRPGFIIGKRGEQINELEKFLTTEILLEEAKSTITDKIMIHLGSFSSWADVLDYPDDDMDYPLEKDEF